VGILPTHNLQPASAIPTTLGRRPVAAGSGRSSRHV